MRRYLYIILLIIFVFTGGFGHEANAAAIELYSTSLYSDSGLVSYYRLSDVNDSKGSNNLTNNGSVTFPNGLFGLGANFGSTTKASTQYLSSTADFGIAVGGNISICYWTKLNVEISNNADTFNFVLRTVPGAAGNALWVDYEYNSGTRRLNYKVYGSGNSETYNVTLGTSNWHFICQTSDGTTNVNYFDGSPISAGISAAGTASLVGWPNFRIGANYSSYTAMAIIDDVSIFNRVLSSTTISNLYTGNFPSTGNRSANIINFE